MSTTSLSFAKGMNTDLTYPLREGNSYLKAENLTYTSRGDNSLGALSNVKGNKLLSTLDLQGQDIVGYATILNSIVLFTISLDTSYIYEIIDVEGINPQLRLIYTDSGSLNKLNFDVFHPIIATAIKEQENIRKVYWVDGVNELRYLNLDDNYTGLDASIFNMVPDNLVNLPINTTILEGGNYKAGVVQHAYQFFRNNGADSTISQLSIPRKLAIATDERDGGNDINDNVLKSVQIELSNIPQQITDIYNRVRIYAVYFESITSAPKINIVNDFELTGSSLTIKDSSWIEDIRK